MEHRAAIGLAAVGADQGIYADTLDKRLVRPDAFDDDGVALHAVERPHMDDDRRLRVAQPYQSARRQAQFGAHIGMDLRFRAALFFDRRARLGETAVEIIARRRRYQPVGMLRRRLVDRVVLVGQRGQALVVRPQRRPIGLEVKFAIIMGETVEEVRLFER